MGDAVQHCAEQSSCKTPPSLVWALDRIVIEDGEDRQMPWPKGIWSFEEGDQYTIVIIHKALEHTAMAHPGAAGDELAPQHVAITGHYIPKSGKQADYFFITPSIHADWAWYNEVDWFVALANFGGSGASDAPVGSSLWLAAVVVVGLFIAVCTVSWCIAMISRSTMALMLKVDLFCDQKLHYKTYFKVSSSPIGAGRDVDDSDDEKSKIMPQEIGSAVDCVA